jgi:glutamate-1-semialdehyde 2,1-aminomutase
MGHGGTFNANPVTMTAGKVATEMLTSKAIEKLNFLGNIQREGMEKVLYESNIIAKITGVGSILTLHLTEEEVKEFRSSARAMKSLNNPLYISLLNNGISTASRLFTALSTPMSTKEIDSFATAFRRSIESIIPIIRETAPNLILH